MMKQKKLCFSAVRADNRAASFLRLLNSSSALHHTKLFGLHDPDRWESDLVTDIKNDSLCRLNRGISIKLRLFHNQLKVACMYVV